MTYVITQNCCNDASCVPVCPVNCIHPTPDEPEYKTAEMLYIDADNCIECGACLDACPVSAIEPDYDLPDESLPFIDLNAVYYREPERREYSSKPWREPVSRPWEGAAPLRVAVVGTGPAAIYAVQHLLDQRGLDVQIDVFERLLTPWGLVRFGIAPDHQLTKEVVEVFNRSLRAKNVRVFFGVTVGQDITRDELDERYHAVIYGVGASRDKRLGIEGEDLAGSVSATEFVAWYNGHPDYADGEFDLAVEKAVVVGNGNVALDVARILMKGSDALATTDIADHAVEALRSSALREVRVVGRRGADSSAFTIPELLGLKDALGDRLIRTERLGPDLSPHDPVRRYKRELIEELPTTPPADDAPVLVLDYCLTPQEVVGQDRVEALRCASTDIDPVSGEARAGDDEIYLDCSLLIRSVGYRAEPIADVPFDEDRHVVPNDKGRVVHLESGEPHQGTYVVGWVKRGPSGVVGTNRHCARETVESLLDDFEAGRLKDPTRDFDPQAELDEVIGFDAWRVLDAHERNLGKAARRPRVKVVDPQKQREIVLGA